MRTIIRLEFLGGLLNPDHLTFMADHEILTETMSEADEDLIWVRKVIADTNPIGEEIAKGMRNNSPKSDILKGDAFLASYLARVTGSPW